MRALYDIPAFPNNPVLFFIGSVLVVVEEPEPFDTGRQGQVQGVRVAGMPPVLLLIRTAFASHKKHLDV